MSFQTRLYTLADVHPSHCDSIRDDDDGLINTKSRCLIFKSSMSYSLNRFSSMFCSIVILLQILLITTVTSSIWSPKSLESSFLSNHNSSKSNQHELVFTIYEGVPIGTFVGIIRLNDSQPFVEPPFLIVPITSGDVVDVSTLDKSSLVAIPTYAISSVPTASKSGTIDTDLNIDQSTGEIRTTVVLDREQRKHYSFIAISLTGVNIHVKIIIEDVNDNAPHFLSPEIELEFPENSKPRDVKRTLPPAKDLDQGVFGIQSYRIVSGNIGNAFRLISHREKDDNLYLDLQVNNVLDRETLPNYSLVIEALDGGQPPLKDQLTVKISILDINDCEPVFSQSHYYSTITKNVTVGTQILKISATDNDQGENAHVIYSLHTKNNANFASSSQINSFAIDKETGSIYVARSLDFESQESFELVVFAKDQGVQPLETSALVSIRIINLKEKHPTISLLFLTENSKPAISEDAKVGDLIARLTMKTMDENGDYSRDVSKRPGLEASLHGAPNEEFTLKTQDNLAYLIVVNGKLDRERQSRYSLTIVFNENGFLSKSSNFSHSFELEILDVNDNPPYFDMAEFHITVPETADAGSSVFQMRAHDKDSDAVFNYGFLIAKNSHELLTDDGRENNNLETRISLTSQPRFYQRFNSMNSTHVLTSRTRWFALDHRTGLIVTRAQVDCETEAEPKLVVLVTDSDDDDKKRMHIATAVLRISISDINDNEPIFDQSFYNVTVPEDTQPGHCILQISATDPDCGMNALVNYSFATNNFANNFGSIYLKKKSLATFNQDFILDPNSGKLCLEKELDFERTQVYDIPVMATDRGGLSTTAMIKVQVIDTNDNYPIFYPKDYQVSLQAQVANNQMFHDRVPLVIVAASDQDAPTSPNGQITYSFRSSGSTDESYFEINPSTGEIFLTRQLGPHRRSNSNFQLTVIARDGGGRESQEPAIVKISFISSESDLQHTIPLPVFTQRQFNFQIIENVAQGAIVGSIEAKLKERGNQDYKITYGIYSGDPEGYFTIDPQQGIISVRSTKIDREKHSFLLLNVHAYCGIEPGPYRYAHAQVNITILDENDNAPLFPARYLKISIPENVRPGEDSSTVFVAYAIDNDSEQFGQIQYSLFDASIGGNNRNDDFPFKIDSNSGHVKLIRPLDFEKIPSYKLRIVAVDGGQLSNEMIVDFLVQDVNDNSPMFVDYGKKTIDYRSKKFPFYQLTVPENQPVNSHIYQIKVTDKDSGNNARLTYSLEPLNENKNDVESIPIDIFPNNGILYVKDALDRETVEQYRFMIHVTDHGQPQPLNATAIFYLQLSDINDNRPYWHQSVYNFEVPEDAAIGTLIGQVSAFDIDSKADGDNNASLIYNITEIPEAIQIFRINKTNGQIFLKSSIDREKKDRYELSIEVRDQGVPHSLTSEEKATVIIKILDINDNRPIFEDSMFDYINDSSLNTESSILRVQIGTPKQSTLTTFKAKDPDEGENGTVYYSLIDENNLFHLDRDSGILSTKVNIDEQLKKQADLKAIKNEDDGFYRISVIASDGQGKKSKVKVIKIQIVDRKALNLNLDSVEVVNFKIYEPDLEFGRSLGKINLPNAQVSRYRCSGRFFTYFTLQEMENIPLFVDSNDQEPNKLNLLLYDKQKFKKMLHKNGVETLNYLLCIDWPQCSVALFKSDGEGANSLYHSASTKLQCDHYIKVNINVERSNDRLNQNCLFINKNDIYDMKIPWSNADNGRYQQRFNNLLYLNRTFSTDCDLIDYEKIYYEMSSPLINDQLLERLFTIHNDNINNNNVGQTLQFRSNERSLIQQYLLHQDFILSLTAKSSANDAILQSVPIRIKLLSSDSKIGNNLIFLNEKYLELEEDCCLIGSAIIQARINVSHDDFRIKYFLSSGEQQQGNHYLVSNDEQFALNPDSGLLVLKKEFDYERRHEHRINLTAVLYDSKAAIMSVSQIVHIKLLNTNDESPVFLRSNYLKEVGEDVSVGQILMQFEARDADQSPHAANITYLMPSSYQYADYFNLNPRNGEFKLIKPLDRETIEQFNIPIYAFDEQFKHNAFTLAVVKVLDVNDNSPYFVHPNILLKISERVEPGTSILNLIAFDQDLIVQSGNRLKNNISNGLQYRIVSGNVGNKFVLNEQRGELSTNAPLDREMQSSYNLLVEVSDSLHTATSNVTIELLDVNDNAPMFDKSEYYAILRENSIGWLSVVTVRAFDSDGDKLLYSIDNTSPMSNMTRYFRMNSETGEITIHSSMLSYIFRFSNVYSFDVLAIEASKALYQSHVSRVKVHLTLVSGLESTNVDGRLKLAKYPTVIVTNRSPDSFQIGQSIGKFEFIDQKSPGGHSYHILHGQEFLKYFTIQSSTDTIIVKKSLEQDYFQAIVEIRQNNDAWRHSTSAPTTTTITLVQIFIGRRDDHKFVKTIDLNISLHENRLSEAEILNFAWHLKSQSKKNRLYFQLAYANIDLNHFELNPTNGSLRVQRALDYETQPSLIELLVFAYNTDKNDWYDSPVFMFNVTIRLINLDDNLPQFIQQHYIATVFEGERLGSLIGQVNAIDIDEMITIMENATLDYIEHSESILSTLEQHFTYYIVDGNADNAFTIDNKGRVFTNIVLDREIRDRYQLKIIATDMKQVIDSSFITNGFLADEANHAHMTQCTFEVIVVDVNDNVPVFPPYQEISVSEDSEVGAVVATWTANDVDIYPPLSYTKKPVDGNIDAWNLFDIGYSNGKIYLKYPLKAFLATYESFSLVNSVKLGISASDQVHLIDTVITINFKRNQTNLKPIFKNDNFFLKLDMENETQQSVLYDVNVKLFQVPIEKNAYAELDLSDRKIIFSLDSKAGSNGFYIDSTLGIIYNNQTFRINRSSVKIYQLSIFARYQQSNSQSQASLVIILDDGGGHHWHHNYKISKDSVSKPSTSSQYLSSNIYHIEVNSTNRIGLPLLRFPRRHQYHNYAILSGNTNKNFLILRGNELVLISPPLTDHYTLKIRSNGGNRRNSTITVYVKINSQAMQITDFNGQISPFKSKIFELEILENEKIGTEVQSLGTPGRSSYRFRCFSGNEDGMFIVDKYTGSLKINKGLDYEHMSSYRLGVIAEDSDGIGSIHFAIVNINLINVNEYCPQFASNHLKAMINENVPIGTSVLPIWALDKDMNIINYTVIPFSSIVEHDHSAQFRFDPEHNTLVTSGQLDYEHSSSHHSTYKFIVKASDLENNNAPLATDHCGGPVETLLEVQVGSIDEFPPVFSNENYDFKVATTITRSRVKIGKVNAVDQDTGPDGMIKYLIKSVSPASLFNMIYMNSSTGQILMSSFNLTSPPKQYSMVISASSGRLNSLSSTAMVDVRLSIVNNVKGDDESEDPESTNSIDESLHGISSEMTPPGWIILFTLMLLLITGILTFVIRLHKQQQNQDQPQHFMSGHIRSLASMNGGVGSLIRKIGPMSGLGTAVNAAPNLSPAYQFVSGQYGTQTARPPCYDEVATSFQSLRGTRCLVDPSASSGRGSVDDVDDLADLDDVDEEIRIINESSNYGYADDPEEITTTSEYLAKLGVSNHYEEEIENCSIAIEDEDALYGDEITDVLSEIGHGATSESKSSRGKLLKRSKLGTALSGNLSRASSSGRIPILGSGPTSATDSAWPPVCESLNSIVHNEEEFSGSYNWDYLQHWGPKYQPMSLVFAEIARLKMVQSNEQDLMQESTSNQFNASNGVRDRNAQQIQQLQEQHFQQQADYQRRRFNPNDSINVLHCEPQFSNQINTAAAPNNNNNNDFNDLAE